jgi:hypothetical protein
LIITYIVSRTVGVPIVGIEYYVGKLDVILKILQVVVIALSLVRLYKIQQSMHTLRA